MENRLGMIKEFNRKLEEDPEFFGHYTDFAKAHGIRKMRLDDEGLDQISGGKWSLNSHCPSCGSSEVYGKFGWCLFYWECENCGKWGQM